MGILKKKKKSKTGYSLYNFIFIKKRRKGMVLLGFILNKSNYWFKEKDVIVEKNGIYVKTSEILKKNLVI